MQEFSAPDLGGGDAGMGGGEDMAAGPGEKAKDSIQASPEAIKRFKAQQAAVKKIKKQEKKFIKRDRSLGKILSRFIKSKKHSKIATLLARLVARNTPSLFLLAVLALIDQKSREEVSLRLESVPGLTLLPERIESKIIEFEKEEDEEKEFKNLPPEIKSHIDLWTKHIFYIGASSPIKIVLAVVNPDQKVDDTLPQLATFIAIEFLKEHKIKSKYQDIKNFMNVIFNGMIKSYLKTYNEQKKLEDAAKKKKRKDDDDYDDDDEEDTPQLLAAA